MNDAQPSERADIAMALLRAFLLGKTYWEQAIAEDKKAAATAGKFRALVDETVAALSATASSGAETLSHAKRAIEPATSEKLSHAETPAERDRLATPPAEAVRHCTCHPDDRPQICQQQFAASDCQRAAAAVCQPLTEAQITAAMHEADWPPAMLSPAIESKLRQFARAVERAIEAGITGAHE